MTTKQSGACVWPVCAAFILLVAAATAQAQPAVTATSGTWAHQSAVTISGAGFGTKATAAPIIWDNASGTNILSKWDDAWPNCAGNAAYNLAYRTPAEAGRNIPLPHSHITKYLSGAHYSTNPGPQCGYAVIPFKVRTITSFPAYSYISWYERVDGGWHFGDDDNFKSFAYSEGVGPYNLPNNWYLEYNPRPTSKTSGATWHLNDDAFGTSAASFVSPDVNGHSWWWNDAINPMGGTWVKIELEAKYTNQSDGYLKLWENGVIKIDYKGKTDGLPGSTRTEGIGGYARNYPYTTNWRYFADVYLDYSRARVIIGNAPTLAASTIREVQVPTSWSASSISINVNLGTFASGQTAYVFVVDPNGVTSLTGAPITIGGSGGGGGGGGDITPPTASLTAPTNGASLSGSVSVTATAADNIGVAGVQFKLDGVNLGAEDTSSPYSIAWDTSTTTNGSHTLTAAARDAAGNVTGSSAATVTTSNAAPPPPPGGLVAAYGFSEGAGASTSDGSGNNNNATLSGATWTAQGRYGSALTFDGATSLVSIADATSLDLSAAMTLEAWVNPTANTGSRAIIMKEINGGLAYALYASDGATTPTAYTHIVGQTQSAGLSGLVGLPLNTWSHIASTYDGTTLRLFVNGLQVGSAAVGGLMMQSSNPLRLGGDAVWGEYFAGAIDEVRVYSRALSATEILGDMITPVGGTAAPRAPTNLRIVP